MNRKKSLNILFLLTAFFILGCSKEKTNTEIMPEIIAENSGTVTYRDEEGCVITVKKKSEKSCVPF